MSVNVFTNHLGFSLGLAQLKAKDKLTDFKTSKGGIRLTLDKPIPDSSIKDIILARVSESSDQ